MLFHGVNIPLSPDGGIFVSLRQVKYIKITIYILKYQIVMGVKIYMGFYKTINSYFITISAKHRKS